MVQIGQIYDFLNRLAPVGTAEPWDNVGLLAGSLDWNAAGVMVCLDMTREVIAEARREKCELIVSHHPLIFEPIKNMTYTGNERLYDLVRRRVSVICMHTNLDIAECGVNDTLAAMLGLRQTGLCGDNATLRRGVISKMTFADFVRFVKGKLGYNGLRYSGDADVMRVAVGGGACGDMWKDALDAGCDTFVVGEMKYHEFLDAREAGLNVVEAGHFASERPAVFALAKRLEQEFPALKIVVSKKESDIIRFA